MKCQKLGIGVVLSGDPIMIENDHSIDRHPAFAKKPVTGELLSK